MADVTEVIHKISYEVNDEALLNATKAIQLQIAELERLGKALEGYSRQLDKLSGTETQKLDELGRKIDHVLNQISVSAAKTEGVFKQVGKGIVKGLDIQTDLEGLVSKVLKPVRDELGKIDRAGSTSFKNVIGSLFSFSAALDVGLSLLVAVGNEIVSVDGALNGLSATEEAAIKLKERTIGLYTDEKVRLQLLNKEVLDENTSLFRLKQIRDELVNQYPGLANNLAGEANLRLKLADSIGKTNQALLLNAKIKAAEELLIEEEKDFQKGEQSFGDYLLNIGYRIFYGDAVGTAKYIAHITKDHLEKIDTYTKTIAENQKALEESGLNQIFEPVISNTPTHQPANNVTPVSQPHKKSELKLDLSVDKEDAERTINEIAEINVKAVKEKLEQALRSVNYAELQALDELEKRYAQGLLEYEEYQQKKEKITKESAQKRLEEEIKALAKQASEYKEDPDKLLETNIQLLSKRVELQQLQNKDITSSDNKDKDPGDEEQKKNLQDRINGYKDLAEAAVEAYKTILSAQAKALDKEIALQEKKVEAAKKLAERGNTEALRLEEERLEAAQRKREQVARREAIVNSALAVSNSLVAVTGAIANAVKGDPYTLAARVAAAIAAVLGALTAGYAFVKSFDSDTSNAFADGVVGYKGEGGPRDDRNWVRISNGESVITADGTQKNRALLEAINRGAAFHMINPALPLFMPAFRSPQTASHQYASATDLKGVEQKLDEVVGAIEDNKLRQNIFFDEQGVGIMTERAVNRNRKRWK